MKNNFIKRVCAFLLDVLILVFITSLLTPIFNSKTVSNISEKINVLNDSYLNEEISNNDYLNQYMELNYIYDKELMLFYVCDASLIILLFVIVPKYNKGSTIGKKLLKLKIVDKNGKVPSTNSLLVRALLINSLGSILINLALILILSSKLYFIIGIILTIIEILLAIISAFMILYNNEKRGVHDYLAGTSVVNI